MTLSATAVLQAFSTKPPGKEAYDLLPAFFVGPSGEIEHFINAVLETLPNGGTFFDAALSHVSEDALDRLVTRWIPGLTSEGMTEAVESLIAYVSLQRPQALHPYLSRLFELSPNENSYYANWPWRDAPSSALEHLIAQADEKNSPATRMKAFECLLETRLPQALEVCASLARTLPLRHPLDSYFEGIGHSSDGKPFYQADSAHLIFPSDHFSKLAQSWSLAGLHPSWHLPQAEDAFRFGGDGYCNCGLCGNRLQALAELPEDKLGISKSSQLIALQTCLSCLGWEESILYYRHEESGAVVPLNVGSRTPEFPAGPLKECTVKLAQTPPRWRWQDWAMANSRENLHRVGGYPCWIQGSDQPSCPICSQTMTFMLQLDSELPTNDGAAWLWGSGGICYAFCCSSCRTTAYSWQCT